MASCMKIEAALKARLSRLGYDRVTQQNRSRVYGARLLLIPHHKNDGVAALPSIDNSFYCNVSESGFVVAERGALHAGTNGSIADRRVTKEMREAWGGLYIQPNAEELKRMKRSRFRIPFPDADDRDLEMAAG